jgi:hypothetical protein
MPRAQKKTPGQRRRKAQTSPRKPARPGRPSKLTPDTIARFEEALKVGATWKHAAEYAGISRELANQWRIKGEQAQQLKDELEDSTVAELRRRCKAEGRSTAGKKAELIDRLLEDVSAFIDFLDGATRARAQKRVYLLSKIQNAVDNDWRAAKWLLAVDDPDYAERTRTEMTGKDGGPLEIVDAAPVRDAVKAKLIDINARQKADEARLAE